MSISELNKTKNLHNESERCIPITQENGVVHIDMELVRTETETPGSLPPGPIAKLKNVLSIDVIENNIEHRTDTNEEVDERISENISELKVHVLRPADARRKSTMKEFYDCMVDFGNQQRLERQIRRQKRSPQLPVTTHHGHVMGRVNLTKSQDPLQAHEYAPGPGYLHSQGYPQEEDQGKVARLKGGFEWDRSPFVILVMSITFIMLACTTTFVGIVLMVPDLRDFFGTVNMFLVLIPGTIAMLTVQGIFTYSECARGPPCNFVLLIITVMALSIIAATATSRYKTDIIFQAILITTIIVGICAILACTGFDFTSYIIYVIVISLVITFISIMFFTVSLVTGERMTILHLILIIIGTMVQCVALIIEFQMILGGKSVELNEQDYALGAFFLYSSIINIFLKMLSLLGEDDGF